ncbi:hypothetical protein ACLOJK_010577 [Asimina triloba]
MPLVGAVYFTSSVKIAPQTKKKQATVQLLLFADFRVQLTLLSNSSRPPDFLAANPKSTRYFQKRSPRNSSILGTDKISSILDREKLKMISKTLELRLDETDTDSYPFCTSSKNRKRAEKGKESRRAYGKNGRTPPAHVRIQTEMRKKAYEANIPGIRSK